MNVNHDLEALEMDLLTQALYRQYGYDFRDYAPASFSRRVRTVLCQEGLATVSSLQDRLLHDPQCLRRFVDAVTVNVTSLFRDPGFFLALRNLVVPLLNTYPSVRVWCAGCATGEEAYSVAIVLKEEHLRAPYRIYCTDLNETALKQAQAAIFPLEQVEKAAAAYSQSGGKATLTRQYTAAYGYAIFAPHLRRRIAAMPHSLVSDSSFNEFHLILCRNVLIYFNQTLRARVHRLLYESLTPRGLLCLGSRESLRGSPHEADYETLDCTAKIYRRST